MFGFIDESGSPGAKINDNDWLVVAIVIFRDKIFRDLAKQKLAELRMKLNLQENYEFHRVKNSSLVRGEMTRLIGKLEFDFITIAIKKNDRKDYASYSRVAYFLLNELNSRYSFLDIELDTNPILFSELKRKCKERGIRAKIREDESRRNSCLQIADYVVNIASQCLKNPGKVKVAENQKILNKEISGVIAR